MARFGRADRSNFGSLDFGVSHPGAATPAAIGDERAEMAQILVPRVQRRTSQPRARFQLAPADPSNPARMIGPPT